MEAEEGHTVFLGLNPRENDIKMDLQEVGLWTWTESRWLRIGPGGGHLGLW
jgi:hypothetical protein